jgi:hypothetical protein
MSPFRVVVALVWMVAAIVAEVAGTSTVGQRAELSAKALLSVPPACGGALAVRTEPSPAPAQDSAGLPSLAIPVAPRLTGMPRIAESSLEIVERLLALPHSQRGPPVAA